MQSSRLSCTKLCFVASGTHDPHLSLVAVLLLAVVSTEVHGQVLNFVPVPVDPVVNSGDAQVTTPFEWALASWQLDPGGAGIGVVYAQARTNWMAHALSGDSLAYPGRTGFLMHDISVNVTQNEDDYNYFDIYNSLDGAKVSIWCLSNGDMPDDSGWLPQSRLANSTLIPEGIGNNWIDDRGFVVRVNDDSTTDRHWFPGMPEPGDAVFDWATWYGVFGTSGFNNSAFTNGLPLALDGANEIYELAIRMRDGAAPPECSWMEIFWHDFESQPTERDTIQHDDPIHHPWEPPGDPTFDPPVLKGPVDLGELLEGNSYEVVFTADDPGKQLLQFSTSANARPGRSLVDYGDGTARLTITPTAAQVGAAMKVGIVVVASDHRESNQLIATYRVSTLVDAVSPLSDGWGLRLVPSPVRVGSPLRVTFMAPGALASEGRNEVDLGVYDLRGRRIADLELPAAAVQGGSISGIWQGRDRAGRPVAAGVYIVRAAIPTRGFAVSRKFVVVN